MKPVPNSFKYFIRRVGRYYVAKTTDGRIRVGIAGVIGHGEFYDSPCPHFLLLGRACHALQPHHFIREIDNVVKTRRAQLTRAD